MTNDVESWEGTSPLIYIFMPKKHSRTVHYHRDNKKRRMRRVLRERLKRLSLSDLTFRTCDESDPEECKGEFVGTPSAKKVLRKKDTTNFIQALQYPVKTNCIFTLYGMITIDENALKNQTKDQSLIKALFNFYSLNEVQLNPDYLLIKIHKTKENYFPISYVVDRFKSYGDSYFYDMANKIEEIRSVFDRMPTMPAPPCFSEKQIEKFIDSVRGKRAMLRISPGSLIFTKELLQVGELTISDIGTECLSYRSFVSDVFLADNYRGQVNKFFELYELGKRLRKGEVSQDQYMAMAKQREVEYIVSKKNSVVKIVTSKYNLMPGVGCWEIEQVLGEEYGVPFWQRDMQERKRQFVEDSVSQRLSTLSMLTKVPENLKKLNQGIVCSYRSIEEST